MYKCMVIRRVIHVHCVHCSIPVDLRYSTIISYNSYCIWSMKEHIPCYTVKLLTGQGVAVFGQQMTKHTLPCVFIWHPHIHTFNKPPVSGKKIIHRNPYSCLWRLGISEFKFVLQAFPNEILKCTLELRYPTLEVDWWPP